MESIPSSIFNDVIGPIMRGPSSSHVAGAYRIAKLIRQAHNDDIKSVNVEFDINGSLAESYHGHGTDIGFASGILGMDITDIRVPDSIEIVKENGIELKFNISDYGAIHPNNYRMNVSSSNGITHKWEAISIGGGMIEIQKFNAFDISIKGDFFEVLIICDISEISLADIFKQVMVIVDSYDFVNNQGQEYKGLINIKFHEKLDVKEIEQLKKIEGIIDIIEMKPILPTHSSTNISVPFINVKELLLYTKDGYEMWEMAVLYESKRGNTSKEDIYENMSNIVDIFRNCINEGISGSEYEDRILKPQAYKINNAEKNNILIPSDLVNTVIKYITAIMEVKSSMGVIVAAPTAGSCGCLPGTIVGVAEVLHLNKDEIVKAILAAGLVGVFFSEGATFAAEVAGCQVECGAASGMAAAGLVQMLNGTVEQCIDAASLALQNITGLACDPVANRVEVPCLGKNIMGGMNAIASANMILAGYDKVIPLDETISAIYDIGHKLPLELRCTCGGLGKTPTSLKLMDKLS